MREQKRRRKDLKYGFVAISSESKVVLCSAPTKMEQITKGCYYVMRGCKSFPSDDKIFVEVLSNTKVTVILWFTVAQIDLYNAKLLLNVYNAWFPDFSTFYYVLALHNDVCHC